MEDDDATLDENSDDEAESSEEDSHSYVSQDQFDGLNSKIDTLIGSMQASPAEDPEPEEVNVPWDEETPFSPYDQRHLDFYVENKIGQAIQPYRDALEVTTKENDNKKINDFINSRLETDETLTSEELELASSSALGQALQGVSDEQAAKRGIELVRSIRKENQQKGQEDIKGTQKEIIDRVRQTTPSDDDASVFKIKEDETIGGEEGALSRFLAKRNN